jgi:hypothetical protein
MRNSGSPKGEHLKIEENRQLNCSHQSLETRPELFARFSSVLIDTPIRTGLPLSHRKQTTVVLSNRYTFRESCTPESHSNHTQNSCLNLCLSSPNLEKINRKPELLGQDVSHSKQMTSKKSIANFHRFRVSHLSLLPFPFSLLPLALPVSFSSSSPLVTSRCVLLRNFFRTPGLTSSGWCAFAQPLKNKDLSVRNQLHWSRIQFCETATGHLDPSAVLPDLLGGGN